MMYTEAIRKIFTCHSSNKSFGMIEAMAEEAGYKALCFNGSIWCKSIHGDWTSTCFHITDFQDVQT